MTSTSILWFIICVQYIEEIQDSLQATKNNMHFTSDIYTSMNTSVTSVTTAALLTFYLTPWSRVLLEKLTGFQQVKNSPHFMEPEGSLPHSQVPATCPCPEPARSNPHLHILLPEDPS